MNRDVIEVGKRITRGVFYGFAGLHGEEQVSTAMVKLTGPVATAGSTVGTPWATTRYATISISAATE
jgi:hypothetical protein